MENRTRMLGEAPVREVLIKLSVPAIIGMFVQALYNLVDAIYIGRGVGPLGIAGVGVSFPIQMVVMAFAMMIGIGGASMVSRALGAKDYEKAHQVTGNVFSLLLFFSAIISTLGLIFLSPLLRLFGATDNILPYAREYMGTILLGTVVFSFSMGSNNLVRAEGNARVAMLTMLISAGLNIILDPIFIFALDMGIRGAALATVLSQATTAVYLVFYFSSGKSVLHVHMKNFLWKWELIREMIPVGSASFFRQIAGSALAAILNNTLALYGGDISIAVYGTLNRLLMFLFMPMFGLSQGLQPLLGFNYGARQWKRARDSVFEATKAATLWSVGAFLILLLLPTQLMKIFTTDEELIRQGVHAIRLLVISFPVIGFQVVGASLFQAIGKALPSLFLSMSRQILFLIPLVLVLPRFFELTGVWISFPLADFLAFGITLYMVIREIRHFHRKMETDTGVAPGTLGDR
ncbi:MAG TPA: MATE family efflux transporter [Thermotogota bacterium]|nr:MATE family efflux transporter [Thermotogota bacterium]HRW92752.1 MATE family efflux transporter [Thermotogota bacterium]